MKFFKKTGAILLFISLISAFVLFRMGYFESFMQEQDRSYVEHNKVQESDLSFDFEKRLVIDHENILVINTAESSVFKTVKKKFILEDFSAMIIPSSKVIILGTELPNAVTEDEAIKQRLRDHKIVRVNFTTNRGLKSIKSDPSLLEALELMDKDELKVGARLERFIFDEEEIDRYWKTSNNIVTLSFMSSQKEDLTVSRADVDEFLEWYKKFEELKESKKMTNEVIISSSKSIVTSDKATNRLLETIRTENELFKNKLEKYLKIKL